MVSKMVSWGLTGLAFGIVAMPLADEFVGQLYKNLIPALSNGQWPMLKSFAWDYFQETLRNPFHIDSYFIAASVLGPSLALFLGHAGRTAERRKEETEKPSLEVSCLLEH